MSGSTTRRDLFGIRPAHQLYMLGLFLFMHLNINGFLFGTDRELNSFDNTFIVIEILFQFVSYAAITFVFMLVMIPPRDGDYDADRRREIFAIIIVFSVMILYAIIAELAKYTLFWESVSGLEDIFTDRLVLDTAITLIGIGVGQFIYFVFDGIDRSAVFHSE